MGHLITPVILSGGAGARLWPVSEPSRPKQFHALVGTATMLQMTAARVTDARLFQPPVVVAAEAQADLVETQLSAVGVRPGLLLLEPVGRNTAAALALAALASPPDALLLALPSDHVIQNEANFRAAVRAGAGSAAAGRLVAFGAEPSRPETGYGYIEVGARLEDSVFRIDAFREKPDRALAQAYVAGGRHVWNCGMLLFRASALIAALETHAPDILSAVREAFRAAKPMGHRLTPDRRRFATVRADSIDYAVLEKHESCAVVRSEMGWSDVGSWDALYELEAKDASGNAVRGNVAAIEASGCLLRSDGPRLVVLGARDLIVVARDGLVMILPRGEAQRVREAAALPEAPPVRSD